MVGNDEYHINSEYGLGFRPEFNALKHNIFGPYIRSDPNSKLLFMSATNTNRTVSDLKSILGVDMPECCMMWGSARDYMKTDVNLRLFTYLQRRKHLSLALQQYVFCDDERQFLLYSNYAARYPDLSKDAYNILHDIGNDGYVVSLVGDDFSE